MDSDRDPRSGPTPSPGETRTSGLRRVRRLSNWTAAALLVGTAGGTVALAQHAVPAAGPVSGSSTTGAPGTGTTVTTNGHGGPHVAHTVATTSASGVTTTTTTRVVNGHTVVTHARSAPAFHDD